MTRKEFINSDPQVIEQPVVFKSGQKLKVKCADCGDHITISLGNYYKRRKKVATWACQKCRQPEITRRAKENPLYQSEAYRQKFRDLHLSKEYREKVHNKDNYRKISESTKENWRDPNLRKKYLDSRTNVEERERRSKTAIKRWEDPEYREKQKLAKNDPAWIEKASKRSKELWQDPDFREKMIPILDEARLKSYCLESPSSLQTILYSILDDLGVEFYREGEKTIVGPINVCGRQFSYSFDCLIPRDQGKDLLVDCHGEYWHSGPKAASRDEKKAKFIADFFSDEYEYLVIWEHEYRSTQSIKQTILNALEMNQFPKIDFQLQRVEVKPSEVTSDFKDLFCKHHYLANIGRYGSLRFGFFLNDQIIGGAIFNYPTRLESAKRLGVRNREVLELTRFVIHPSYQKKNLASFCLSRINKLIRRMKPDVKVLLTFADKTHNHDGTIYRASNWKFDGLVKPDYWYRRGTSWFHKKSIWDLASKQRQSESEYAKSQQLIKIRGKQKLRFVYWL